MTSEKTALIIIDLQQGMKSTKLPPRNNPDAENNIAKLLNAWRQSSNPVINVRHISRFPDFPNSSFFPGRSCVEFQEPFLPQPEEHVVEKNVPDAFIHTGLERWLHVRDIRNLVIVGVSTSNSVESTARTAGNLGFKAIVVSDATFTFEKRDFAGTLRSADEVHFMSLANLDGEYAVVRSTDEVLAAINY
jgi:nicotinamidase-related amidase